MRATVLPYPILAAIVIAAAALLAAVTGHAQSLDAPAIAVATKQLDGTRWARTVMIVTPRMGTHIGLIINRPLSADTTMAKLFPDFEPARDATGLIYLGGPQHSNVLFALTRGERPSPISIEMMPGLWLVTQANEIDALLIAKRPARYFVGAIIWRPGALEEEVKKGQIVLRPADAEACFREDASGLWDELVPAGPST